MLSAPQRKAILCGDRLRDGLEGKTRWPVLLEVDLTGYCDANCPFCFYRDSRSGEHIQAADLIKTLNNAPLVKAVNLTGGGEPTLHPEFNQIVDSIDQQLGIFTNARNGRIAKPERFSWIRVSLTEKYMDGVDTDLVKFYALKTKTGICLNLTEDNQEMVEELCLAARRLGVAYFQIRPALVRDYRNQPHLSPPTGLEQFESVGFKVWVTDYKFEECHHPKTYGRCYGGWLCLVIDYRGDVRWCNYFLDNPEYPHVLGSIYERPFEEILANAPDYVDVDGTHMSACKNHESNKLLFNTLDGPLEDKYFI